MVFEVVLADKFTKQELISPVHLIMRTDIDKILGTMIHEIYNSYVPGYRKGTVTRLITLELVIVQQWRPWIHLEQRDTLFDPESKLVR